MREMPKDRDLVLSLFFNQRVNRENSRFTDKRIESKKTLIQIATYFFPVRALTDTCSNHNSCTVNTHNKTLGSCGEVYLALLFSPFLSPVLLSKFSSIIGGRSRKNQNQELKYPRELRQVLSFFFLGDSLRPGG